jgi:hypothetical protein
LWLHEAVHFRLRIEMGAPDVEHTLLQRETFAPKGELGCETYRQRHVTFRRELHRVPLQVAKVQRMLSCAAGSERQLKLTAFHGKRCQHIVVLDPAVLNRQAQDV